MSPRHVKDYFSSMFFAFRGYTRAAYVVLRTQISEVKFAVSNSVRPKPTNTYIIRSAVSGATFLHANANMSVFIVTIAIRNYGMVLLSSSCPPNFALTSRDSFYYFISYNITLIANTVMHHNYLSQVSVYGQRKQRKKPIHYHKQTVYVDT